jgi:hypothetical protein
MHKMLGFKFFCAMAASIFISISGAFAETTSDAEKSANALVTALAKNNLEFAANDIQKRFVRAYASASSTSLNGFENFIRGLEDPSKPICNYLCQRRVAAAFWFDTKATPIDLVRYVFTATCFGLRPGPTHRGAALKQLESALGKVADDELRQLFVTNQDRYFVRVLLGDVAATEAPEFSESPKFTRWTKFWRSALTPSYLRTRPLPKPIGPIDLAAKDACGA